MMQQAKGAATSVLPGSTFDRTCVDQQLTDHKETLDRLQNQASNGDNADFKAFAQMYTPVIGQHIAELEKLQQQVAQK
jgi:putative membrane protein